MTWLCIALGGALGSLSRHGIGLALARVEFLPLGTLAANILGSLIIGIAAGLWDPAERRTATGMFLITGFCGGFTTFSTFSLQTLELIQKNDMAKAGGNIAASLVLCLAFTSLGFLLGQSLKKTAA